MATITVQRGKDNSFVHVLQAVSDEDQYMLNVLRSELAAAKIMSPPDSFLNKDGAIILNENQTSLKSIFKDQRKVNGDKEIVVETRNIEIKIGVASERMISILRQGESTSSIIFDVTRKLDALRTHLNTAMADDDLFSRKASTRDTISKQDEAKQTVADILSDKDELSIVASSPTKTVSVVKGDQKKSYRINEDKTLAEFRVVLETDKTMATSDVFTLETGDLAKEKEGEVKVKDLKDGTLKIKHEPVIGDTIPKPVVPPMPSPKVEWSQQITYTAGGGAGAAPVIKGGAFDGNLEDNWPTLTWDQKRYIYNRRQLGRAIIIGPSGTAEKDGELKRSYRSAVLLIYPEGEKREPRSLVNDVGFRSKFLSTFSLEAQELHKRSLSTATAGAGMKGMGFTSEVSVASESTDHKLKSRLYISQMFCKPVVKLQTDIQRDVQPNPEFALEVWNALHLAGAGIHRYAKLLDVLGDFGHYLPTEFQLGGAMVWQESFIIDKSKNITMNSFSAASGIEGTIKGVELKAGAGHQEAKKNENENQLEERESRFFTIGGDDSTASQIDPTQWLKSLKKHEFWRVIEYGQLVPTIRFLEPALLRSCLALIKEYAADPVTSRKTYLDMMAYALIAETALPGAELWN